MDWPLLWLTLDIIKYMSKRSGFLRAWFNSPRFRLIWSRYNPLMPSISNLIFRQRLSPLDATYHICVMEEELQILVISSTLHIKTGNLKYNCSPIFGQTNHACRNAVVFSVCILPFFAKDVRDPWLRLGLSESPSDIIKSQWTTGTFSRRHRTSLREALEIRIADFKGCVLLPLLLLLFE